MSNISHVIATVQTERFRVQEELKRLDDALHTLQKLAATEPKGRRVRTSKRRRKMSSAARKRIAAAQRARWARVRKQKAK